MLLLQEDHRGPTAKHELYDFESSGFGGVFFPRLYSLPPAKMCIWECYCIISGWRRLAFNSSELSCSLTTCALGNGTFDTELRRQ